MENKEETPGYVYVGEQTKGKNFLKNFEKSVDFCSPP